MKMTPALLVVGALMVFWASSSINVIIPALTMKELPSEQWRPFTGIEAEGHRLYIKNGCGYCHSLYIRINDWGHGAGRIAQSGDYVGYRPIILGTMRTGPDLSQEGGERPDDWHIAHFINPRFTSPISVMPSWKFLGMADIVKLTAFMQALGGQNADVRVARQLKWKLPATLAYQAGPDENIRWLHAQIPEVWQRMPNPYPALESGLQRGKRIYQDFCVGCHGVMGDGEGPAAKHLFPPPLNFTTLRRHLVEGKYIGGIFYYQIMNGIAGTAMPYFKKDLESEKIWDLSNYLAVSFLGYSDADIAPEGIDAPNEPLWINPFVPPAVKGKIP